MEKSTASSPSTTANKALLAVGGHGDATMHRVRSKKAYVKAMGNDVSACNVCLERTQECIRYVAVHLGRFA